MATKLAIKKAAPEEAAFQSNGLKLAGVVHKIREIREKSDKSVV